MPPAVAHRLAITHCCSGTSWCVTRSQLPSLWWFSVAIPSTTCALISSSLFCFQTTRSTASSTSVDTATTQTRMGRYSLRTHCGSWVAVAATVATVVSRASCGRDCDDRGETREDSDCCFFGEREDSIPASATGIVVVVVREGGNCTTSVLGQGICTRIHETGHHVKAWCETSSHVKVEWMVDACDWPTRGTSCHRTKQLQQSAAMRTLWTPKISTFRCSPGCTQESHEPLGVAICGFNCLITGNVRDGAAYGAP